MTEGNKTKLFTTILVVCGTIITTLITVASTGVTKGLDKKVDKTEYEQKCKTNDNRIEILEKKSDEQMQIMIQILQKQERANTNIEWLIEDAKKNK